MRGGFLDTNILLYSISARPEERPKRLRAIELLDLSDHSLSTQVLQEFFVQSTRPTKVDAIPTEDARLLVQAFMRFRTQDITVAIVMAALDIAARHSLSYWDSAIVAAAQALNCETLYSEDMSHGTTIGGTTIVNPFR